MTVYQLYLESGPKRKKTLVHVLDLLGCVAGGPTTEAALERTPNAIRAFLRFLERHGQRVDPAAEFRVEVAAHLTEGIFLGNGDPTLVFGPDLLPLTTEDGETYIARLEWLHADLVDLVGGLSDSDWDARPAHGRTIRAIVEHVLESEYAYMAAFGKLEGLPGPGAILTRRDGLLLDWLAKVRAREIERLRGLSEAERIGAWVHWKHTRTARKVVRRVLEHAWEHMAELQARLEKAG